MVPFWLPMVKQPYTLLLIAAKEAREDIDFFPLQVEYREKHYAGGKIPGGFFKREARPGEHEVLTSRVTDRPIRPLFPKGFKNETQVIITVLQSDGENMSDVLAGVGASAALMLSSIPWNGPIATVRVGRINGEFEINPTRTELEDSDMEMVVSGNNETVVMVEGEDIAWSDLFPAHSLGLLLTSVVLSRVVAALSVSVRELELDSLILVGPPFGAHRSRKNAVSLAASHAADMLCLTDKVCEPTLLVRH